MTQPWWQPERLAAKRQRLEARGRILHAVRQFFAEAGFVEVDTPALQVSPGLEPHLQAFQTTLHDPLSAEARIRYLHTSPEFAMKKLLAGGMERIWQLAHVFRNGERSATHHPEFSMIEWYRAGASYTDLMDDCEALLRRVQQAASVSFFAWKEETADVRLPWQRLTIVEAFEQYAGIDLAATLTDPEQPDAARLAAAVESAGITPHAGDDWETLFFRVMLDRIEPHLGSGAPTILYDYPLPQAALARRKQADPRFAERFELYVCGLELANGFGELTDAAEQRVRFEADQARKQALYGNVYPIDEEFLTALEHGLPECAGIALGFDRLVMLATGADSIEDVLWAPAK